MKNKLFFLVAVLLISGNIVLAQQNEEFKAGKHRHECKIEDLSTEQQTAINQIKLDLRQKNQILSADLKIKKAELDKLLIADNPNEKEIDKKIEEIGNIKTQIQKNKVHSKIQIRALLTPEQRVKFDSKKMNENFNNSDCNKHHRGNPHHKQCK